MWRKIDLNVITPILAPVIIISLMIPNIDDNNTIANTVFENYHKENEQNSIHCVEEFYLKQSNI